MVTFLREEGILLLDVYLQFLRLELKLLAEDQTRMVVENIREVYVIVDDCRGELVEVAAGYNCKGLQFRIVFLFLQRDIELVDGRRDCEVRLGLGELILR